MGNIREVTKWQTPDGRLHDTFTEANNHEQRYLQKENIREALDRHGMQISNEALGIIADYILSEFEPS